MMTLLPDIAAGDDSGILPSISSFTDQNLDIELIGVVGGAARENSACLDSIALRSSLDIANSPHAASINQNKINSGGSSISSKWASIYGQIPSALPAIERSRLTNWEIVERERQRFSRDIHDVSGQYIVSMLFRLAALERNVTDLRLLSQFADLRETLTHFSEELQQLATGERPGVPPGYRLVASLSDLIGRWENQVGITTRFRHHGMNRPDLDDRTTEAVFRIVQEALTNIAKHATTASMVTIRLRLMPDYLMLLIEDDGYGPGPASTTEAANARKRCGIAGMIQRVTELGGTFAIRARRGSKGTRLVATIPLLARRGLRRSGGDPQ
ncbi:sensor histidine kinase [Kaistia terrae]|uniref:histidine kinase n=1 Tax=Kaistia terrae TaxID=537017 RepID=A0ABW0PY33_9HYPH|nr:histidine kinase [Kaistia terrae]MCX5578533.1 histidine kinase [Kaistia terrae]